MSWPLAVIPLASLFLEVCLARKVACGRVAWGWLLPSLLVLAFLGVWAALGLVEGELIAGQLLLSCAVILGSGLLTQGRERLWAWYDARGKALRCVLCVGLVLASVTLCVLALEVPFNDLVPFGSPSFLWLEGIYALLLLASLYFLGQRHAIACGAGMALFAFIGIAQYFVKRFKHAAILPADLFALGTAAAVTSEYTFSLDGRAVAGLAVLSVAFGVLALVRPPSPGAGMRQAARVAQNLALAAGSIALLAFMVIVPSYREAFGTKMSYWSSIDIYQMQGFLPTFVTVMQDMPIKQPADYTDDLSQGLIARHADSYRKARSLDDGFKSASRQFEEERPSVVVIMNESFADLSMFDGMHAGYEGPRFFREGFPDALLRGPLNVSVHGGGTCNSEFEFLTSNSQQFFGAGKLPYSIYDLANVDSLAKEFSQWGYRTVAIHPNYASNWNRQKVYGQLGFDQFLSIDDFGGMPDVSVDRQTPNEPHAEVFHSGVSDAATYDRILQMLSDDDGPQFIFDVTMANHGSYRQGNIPQEYVQHYVPTDYEGGEKPESLNEYLACIQKSDDDLRKFVSSLKELDRPVMLVFFGDHQPIVTTSYVDCWYPDDPENVHARRIYRTEYVIWANYDVAGRAQNGECAETSVDMLGAEMLDLIGAPASDFQAALLDTRTLIPSLSIVDYKGADGTWYMPEDVGPYSDAYHDLALMEYHNFARKLQ